MSEGTFSIPIHDLNNGIIIKFPRDPKKKEPFLNNTKFLDFIYSKIKEGGELGFKFFLFELRKEDFQDLNFNTFDDAKIEFINAKSKEGFRIGFYIRSGNFLTSEGENLKLCIKEINTCSFFLDQINHNSDPNFPIIVHIGGSHGDRKKTMDLFCRNFKKYLKTRRLYIINDEKPSLFSVKDLLSGIFYNIKTPIVFRYSSHKTNQGNLTTDESLLLSSSTWDKKMNPVMIYIPQEGESLSYDQTQPYGTSLDIIYDNRIPENT